MALSAAAPAGLPGTRRGPTSRSAGRGPRRRPLRRGPPRPGPARPRATARSCGPNLSAGRRAAQEAVTPGPGRGGGRTPSPSAAGRAPRPASGLLLPPRVSFLLGEALPAPHFIQESGHPPGGQPGCAHLCSLPALPGLLGKVLRAVTLAASRSSSRQQPPTPHHHHGEKIGMMHMGVGWVAL